MKIYLLKITAILSVFISIISCKDTKQNEIDTTEAKEEQKEITTEALTYTINTEASTIYWTGAKPTGKHTGTIKLTEGIVTSKGGQLESGNFTIDMNTITVTDLEGDKKSSLEGHLKGTSKESEDHFFNVSKFPTASFVLTKSMNKEGKTLLEGNLTIKGIEKQITFPVKTHTKDDTMTITSEAFTIDRTLWNINYASKSIFTDIGDKFINDTIELTLEITAKKQ